MSRQTETAYKVIQNYKQTQKCNGVLQELQESGDLEIVRKTPKYGKDWNELLQIQQQQIEEQKHEHDYYMK